MAPQKIWLNLPVKNLEKSKAFFSEVGIGHFDTEHGNSEYAALLVGENKFHVMLFSEEKFQEFSRVNITNTKESVEVLISLDAQSREEVDEYAVKVRAAGGVIFAKPAESMGWMYGFGFADLDGHRWNFLFMDFAKLPQQQNPNCSS